MWWRYKFVNLETDKVLSSNLVSQSVSKTPSLSCKISLWDLLFISLRLLQYRGLRKEIVSDL